MLSLGLYHTLQPLGGKGSKNVRYRLGNIDHQAVARRLPATRTTIGSRVFVHRPLELALLDRHPECGVDALHRAEGVCTQLLVADQDLRSSVGIVGLPGV